MWTVRGDGVVIGRIGHHESGYVRREISSLQRIVRNRLATAPVTMPFGTAVSLATTANLPEDERLLVLLAHFVGEDEPEWLWRWHEHELWTFLESCARYTETAWVYTSNDGEVPTRIELRDNEARTGFFQSIQAIAVIAGHRIEREPESEQRNALERVHRWFVAAANGLDKLSNQP